MNPCKDEKCITYPICLNKKAIHCPKVIDYIKTITEEGMLPSTRYYTELWQHLLLIFPYANSIVLSQQQMICRETTQSRRTGETQLIVHNLNMGYEIYIKYGIY